MYEVELKVEADHDAVRDRLEALGADRLGVVTQEDTYYDAPHRDFAATDEAFRIRRESHGDEAIVELTYKGPKVDAESKTREEIETAVESGSDADAIFRALGFEAAAVVEKDRDRYHLNGYTVTLDSVDGLGEFVEVEIEAEEVDDAREGAKEVMMDLGLDPDEQIRTSYLGLLLGDAEE
ncbi:adenylate cyclase [Halomicrobium zhouii]|uniref:Adenylate cyclase n=1 Tax=Halomicrobium zhouii TaxID=767519 RepID=A0A1I6LVM2_9EURY|nr:class IV adenylate cyclase [Halomicrobium zhouii]SFS07479.1 adenylate cyclase [Halomicrobium zhouii]